MTLVVGESGAELHQHVRLFRLRVHTCEGWREPYSTGGTVPRAERRGRSGSWAIGADENPVCFSNHR